MALMRTSNPALNAKTFADLRRDPTAPAMTLEGTVNKAAFLLFLVAVPAAWVWSQVRTAFDPAVAGPWIALGVISGLIAAIVTIVKKAWSPVTAPIYAAFEGLALGGLSALLETKYPGIVMQAVGLTFATLAAMLLAYRSGLIKATEKFKLGVVAATGAIALYYLIGLGLSFFGIAMPFLQSPREAVGAPLLLRAIDRDHARRHHQHAGEQVLDPFLLDRLCLQPHVLREPHAVEREGDVAHAHEHALREQLVGAHAGDGDVAGLEPDEGMADRGPLRGGIRDLEGFAELVLRPHRAFHRERDARVTEHDDDGVLGVGRAVGFVRRVEEDAPPREREAVVRLRHVEHHLVLPGDLVQPRFEIGICGRVAAGGQRLGGRFERGEQSAEADCGGAGGDASQESAPMSGEALQVQHGHPPVGEGYGDLRRAASVGYATSGGESPFGQSWIFSGKSGRGCAPTYAATSNAS